MKDKLSSDYRAAVIYKIPCGDCQKVYVGETARTLKQRFREYKRALKNLDRDASGLAEHATDTCHAVQWSEAMVVQQGSRDLQRRLLESLHIGCELETMNRALPTVYCSLNARCSALSMVNLIVVSYVISCIVACI